MIYIYIYIYNIVDTIRIKIDNSLWNLFKININVFKDYYNNNY